jgi:ribosome-binding protein aMBF1 (putative translation factor)
MNPEQVFAKRMRQVRERRGWSQAKLADWMRTYGVDLHSTAITRIERGERSISLNEASAVAAALGVLLVELLQEVQCEACGDAPPAGFACKSCGAS